MVTDDPNTLSLQHFDGDYTDSSSFNRTFYSQNRSTNYVDSGAFGKAVTLPNGSAAGVTIPGLSRYNSLSFDFRVYYNDISSLGIYFGDTCIFEKIPAQRVWKIRDTYTDDGELIKRTSSNGSVSNGWPVSIDHQNTVTVNKTFTYQSLAGYFLNADGSTPVELSTSYSSSTSAPTSYSSPGYEAEADKKYGWMATGSVPSLYSSNTAANVKITSRSQLYAANMQAFYYYGGRIVNPSRRPRFKAVF